MIHKKVLKTKHRVIGCTMLSEYVFILSVERNGFTFKAGQFVNISLPNGNTSREYSMYSGENNPQLEFLIRVIPNGFFSPLLKKLTPNDSIEIDGPYDEMFTIESNDIQKKHYLIATGTGIAPFHSFVQTYPALKYVMIHGVRFNDDLVLGDEYTKESYISCVSQDTGGSYSGRVTEFIKKHPLERDAYIYLCGNSTMIFETKDYLTKSDFLEKQIFTELFF